MSDYDQFIGRYVQIRSMTITTIGYLRHVGSKYFVLESPIAIRNSPQAGYEVLETPTYVSIYGTIAVATLPPHLIAKYRAALGHEARHAAAQHNTTIHPDHSWPHKRLLPLGHRMSAAMTELALSNITNEDLLK